MRNPEIAGGGESAVAENVPYQNDATATEVAINRADDGGVSGEGIDRRTLRVSQLVPNGRGDIRGRRHNVTCSHPADGEEQRGGDSAGRQPDGGGRIFPKLISRVGAAGKLYGGTLAAKQRRRFQA